MLWNNILVQALLLIVALQVAHLEVAEAFSPSFQTRLPVIHFDHIALYATSDGEPLDEYSDDSASSYEEPSEMTSPASPPPPVPVKRLDPLLASLTRTDPSVADLPTRNLPLIGEVPLDGSMMLLGPAAFLAVAGLLMSVVIGFQSKDLFVDALNQVSEEVTLTAQQQANQVYDENVCRGLCSSQESDLEGLRTFMESLGGKK